MDSATGATVVVPDGSVLRAEGSFCIADVHGAALQEIVKVAPAAPMAEVHAASMVYEQELTQRFSQGPWQLDPAWTYLAPLTRPDGLTVRRKGNVQIMQTAFGPARSRYAFETLAAKGSMFRGVTGFRHNYSLQALQLQQACMIDSQTPGCTEMLRELRRLAQMMIATHLSTFSMG